MTRRTSNPRPAYQTNFDSENMNIVCTNDPFMLQHSTLLNRFDAKKHCMPNYIDRIGPPRKKLPDMSN